MSGLLLCGGTGRLGGAIATRLARQRAPFRALVRPRTDGGSLRALGAEICPGDLTDRPGLDRAVAGISTVVTSANAIGRVMGGERSLSVDAVDRRGNVELIRAAEAAGVRRFVFVSLAGLTDEMVARSPLAAAKRATEHVLASSPMRTVVVRPAPLQEVWLAPETGIEPANRRAVIFGRGRMRASYVAVDDVAEACVRLTLADDPPALVEFGGPEAMTRYEVVDAFERAFGTRFRRIPVPRPVLLAGARLLRGPRPAMASVLGMSATLDEQGCDAGPEPLRRLGIEPRATTDAITALARALSGSAES